MNLDDYDWQEAFYYCNAHTVQGQEGLPVRYTTDDVVEILDFAEGDNDGPSWEIVFRARDGQYVYLTACCDYTGWDCQAGGSATRADTLNALLQFGIGYDSRLECIAVDVILNGVPTKLPRRFYPCDLGDLIGGVVHDVSVDGEPHYGVIVTYPGMEITTC